MSEERRRILDMLAEGKITAEQAEKLMDAMNISTGDKSQAEPCSSDKPKPKCLRIMVAPKEGREGNKDQVNIRIPLALVKTGMKLGSLMPEGTRGKVNAALEEKGIKIDLGNLNKDTMKELIDSLCDMSIDVDDEKEKVRIFCE